MSAIKLTRLFYRDLLKLAREFPSFQTRAFIVHQTRTRFRAPLEADDAPQEDVLRERLEAAHTSIEILENALDGDSPHARYLQDAVDGVDLPADLEDYDMMAPPRKPNVSAEKDTDNEKRYGSFLYPHTASRSLRSKYEDAQHVRHLQTEGMRLTVKPVFRLIA
jgi:hypothetical protein